MIRLAALLSLVLLGAPALAQSRIDHIGADVRRSVAEAADAGVRAFTTPTQRNAASNAERSPSIAPTLAAATCDTTSDRYWDAAAPWIRRNAQPATMPPGATIEDGIGATSGNLKRRESAAIDFGGAAQAMAQDMRQRVQRIEETIQTSSRRLYLLDNDVIARRPPDRAADLRQRAEWMTFVIAFLPQLKAAHEAQPRDFEKAFVFAVWTRATCDILKSNRAAALAALNDLGFPDATRFGGETEIAFAMLVRAGNEPVMAREALRRGGDTPSAMARQILEPLAARAPAEQKTTP